MTQLGFNIPSLIVFLVNFAILLGVLYVFAYKPIFRVIDQRAARIQESLEAADRARQEAAQSHETTQEQMAETRREGQRLLDQARDMAEKYKEDEREKAKQEAGALLAKARAEIQRERDEAIDEVRSHFAGLAITAAERVIERSVDASAHKDIIDRVLEESPPVSGGKAD